MSAEYMALKTLTLAGLVTTVLWVPVAYQPILGGQQASADPSIALSPSTGQLGTQVSITGAGFPAGEVVALYIDSPGPYLGQPGPVADASGGFTRTGAWPGKEYDKSGNVNPSTPGPHQVCGDTGYPGSAQAVSVKACAIFTVLAAPSPSPSPSPVATPQNAVAPPLPVPAILASFLVLAVLVGALLFYTRRNP